MEQEVDELLGMDLAALATLPSFEWEELAKVMDLHREDDIQEMIKFIEDNAPSPNKTEVLSKSAFLQKFFRNRSCFKLTQQKILIRVWLDKNGSTTPLIVTSYDAYKQLVSDAHTQPSSVIKHVGCRRTFTAISRRYFSFNGCEHVSKIIGACPICRLNNYSRGTPSRTGYQLSLRPNKAAALDVVGPLQGFAQTISRRPRYVICYIDLHSRLTIAKCASSAADDEILLALKGVRHRLVGLPRRLLVDNALINDGLATANFLRSHGVQVTHGLAYVSRCQSKVERCIGSFTRLLCKLHTQQPDADINMLVEEAALTMNSTPSESLGGRLSMYISIPRHPTSFRRYTMMARTS